MNLLFLTGKMNLFPKLWKQFDSFISKKERESETVMENPFPFMKSLDSLTEDDGLRWDRYGNPYISSKHFNK